MSWANETSIVCCARIRSEHVPWPWLLFKFIMLAFRKSVMVNRPHGSHINEVSSESRVTILLESRVHGLRFDNYPAGHGLAKSGLLTPETRCDTAERDII